MVVDGCFILELFHKVDDPKRRDPNDPIFKLAWILPFIFRDFLWLENQIPYFILEKLFEVTRLPDEEFGPSLSLLALWFFKYIMQRRDNIIQSHHDLKGLHLLDMVRSSFFPPDQQECPKWVNNAPTHIIHNVSNLRCLGIRLNPIKADSFLVVKFKHGVIEIPNITIDDYTTSFLVNCVAFEQCHNSCSKHITTYATFLDCLVKTAKDVEYLYNRNIIELHICTSAEVARFLNNLGRDVEFDIDMSYLSKLFDDVHHYYQNSWHAKWERFKYTYFDAPGLLLLQWLSLCS